MIEPPPRPYVTGAWLDFTTIAITVDLAALRAAIAPFPELEIAAPPGATEHPVYIDLSRVRDGRPEPGGVDQHTWSEAWGLSAGSSLGALWGAGAGALWGAWMGPIGAYWGSAAGSFMGAAQGAWAGRHALRGVSEIASKAIGTYNEAMAFVPDVHAKDGRGPFLFSLGMWTDSALSKRLAEVYRSGFGKRIGHVESRTLDAYEVRAPAGDLLCSGAFDADPARIRPARAAPELTAILRRLAQPILGHAGSGALMITHVDRFYDAPSVRVAEVTGRLVIRDGFAPGVPAGEWNLGDESGALAFRATYVPVRLDFPVPLVSLAGAPRRG
ncbi:Hypothetical protein A7982_06491 [Minicystis rosea]|nr:Hypothetical protein A7982_06491 [Minicystis rosea]